MPLTFVIALAAAFSMGGLFPFFGFIAKEEIYYALSGFDRRSMVFAAIAILGNALMFAVAFAVALKPFIGAKVETPKAPHEAPFAALARAGAACRHGAFRRPAFGADPRTRLDADGIGDIRRTADGHDIRRSACRGAPGHVDRDRVDRHRFLPEARSPAGLHGDDPCRYRLGPDRGFDQFIRGLVRFSVALTRRLQSGRLDVYMTATFILVAFVLLVVPLSYGELPRAPFFAPDVPLHELAIMAIAVIGLVAVVLAPDRLTAIVSLGIQGFAVAVIFLLYGAPDLAFTQFMIETLSVVVLALVMTRLRLSPSDHRPFAQKVPDFAIALACGLGFGLMLLKATGFPLTSR